MKISSALYILSLLSLTVVAEPQYSSENGLDRRGNEASSNGYNGNNNNCCCCCCNGNNACGNQNSPGDQGTGGQNPSGKTPSGQTPGNEKSGKDPSDRGGDTGGQDTNDQGTGGEKPNNQKPPGDDRTGTQKPGDDKTGSEKPGDDKTGNEKPGDDKPGDDKPGDDKPGDKTPSDDQPGIDDGKKKDNEAVDDFLRDSRKALKIEKTTKTPNGQIVDWIPLDSQGSIASSPPRLLLDSPDPARPDGDGTSDLELQGAQLGPPGTVPIVRSDVTLLDKSVSLEDFLDKKNTINLTETDTGNSTRYSNHSSFALAASGDPPHWYAYSNMKVDNYGTGGQLNLANPKTLKPDFSLMQTAVSRTDGDKYPGGPVHDNGRYDQTLESGLIVQPGRYNDYKTHLFSFFNTNGYNGVSTDNIKGWNREVKGWVQIAKKIAPGIIFTPPSVDGGQQYKVWIVYQLHEGNWWLWVKNEWIGYYPASLYSSGRPDPKATLGDHGDYISWYGEVFDAAADPNPTSTDMGTGQYPSTGFQHSAYIHNLVYKSQPGAGNSNQYYDGSSGTYRTDTAQGYQVDAFFSNRNSWGSYFYLGGPGTEAAP